MACPTGTIRACDFPQFWVQETPKFDELIMEDIRPTDGWLLNIQTGTNPMGTPTEITQDRFRHVFPNTTKAWGRVANVGAGCVGNPCDPPEHEVGWGADRLTYFTEEQVWKTPLTCYNQDMHITHVMEHIEYLISKILRPATTAVSSNFLRKRHLFWAKKKWQANRGQDDFTYVWTLAGPNADEEIYFDCSVDPNNVFLLVPQMLQRRWQELMLRGYNGENPFKDEAPFVELVTDMDTIHSLEHLGGQQGVGIPENPSLLGNWRFQNFNEASKYWRYGFSGEIGNFGARVDPMGLRFNFVGDLGANAAPNRFRYQVLLPYRNGVTTGAGGAAGLGSDVNPDYLKAHFGISQIHHKRGMELLVSNARPLNSQMHFSDISFGGEWKWLMHDLGPDVNGAPIKNDWGNKGRFGAWFKYMIRPLHTEFMEAIFHKREQFCVPEIDTCSPDPGYPEQEYNSALPHCPLPELWPSQTGVPAAGILPHDTFQSLVETPGATGTGNPDDQ